MTKVLKDRYALRKEINDYLDNFDYNDMHIEWDKISRDPWLFDSSITVEEAMILKLKNKCPQCGMDPRYHRDDCEFRMNQLMFRELESGDNSFIFYVHLMGELAHKKKALEDS